MSKLCHAVPDWVQNDAVFFVTICCRDRGKNSLALDTVAHVTTQSLKFHQESRRMWTHLWLNMPDHVHGLISLGYDQKLDSLITNWKRWLATHARVAWQRGFFDHRLRNDDSLQEKADYIINNPVRAILVPRSDDWKYYWTSNDLSD